MKHPSRERILLVDGQSLSLGLIADQLMSLGYTLIDKSTSMAEAWDRIEQQDYSVVLLSHNVNNQGYYELLNHIKFKKETLPVILMIDKGDVQTGVEAVRLGAFDVLERPLHPDRLRYCIQKSLEYGHVRTETICLQKEASADDCYHGIVGRSSAMKKVFNLIERIRESSVNILITGPSGTGKEKLAKALHETSPRKNNKFVAINCSAIPDALLEGELFGYKRGAFTDARQDKMGLFLEAQGGTIFLDEIGDMPLTIQPKILRALQEREIRPLGSTESINVDVRIIAATNQNLQEKIAEKSFREDLFYRLNAMEIELPSLCERKEDIALLVDYFIDKFQREKDSHVRGISQKALKQLFDYSWPGNIRELENIIERATLLCRDDMILPEDLLFSREQEEALPINDWVSRRRPLSDIEKEYILEVLQASGGNRSETAQILGIGRKTLYNKLAKYGV